MSLTYPLTYPVATVVDMARVPVEAWPRLAAELPAMLAVVKPLVELYDEMRAAGKDVPQSAYDMLVKRLDWVDDTAGTIDVTLTDRDTGNVLAEHHFVMSEATHDRG